MSWQPARPSARDVSAPQHYPSYTAIVGGDRNPYRSAHTRHPAHVGQRVRPPGWRSNALSAVAHGVTGLAALMLGVTIAGFEPRLVLVSAIVAMATGAISAAGSSAVPERGLVAAAALALGALLPLAAWALVPLQPPMSGAVMVALSLIALAAVGAIKADRAGASVWFGATRAVSTGALAMASAAAIGLFFSLLP